MLEYWIGWTPQFATAADNDKQQTVINLLLIGVTAWTLATANDGVCCWTNGSAVRMYSGCEPRIVVGCDDSNGCCINGTFYHKPQPFSVKLIQNTCAISKPFLPLMLATANCHKLLLIQCYCYFTWRRCLSVCLFISRQTQLWSLLMTDRKSYMGFSKYPLLDP